MDKIDNNSPSACCIGCLFSMHYIINMRFSNELQFCLQSVFLPDS